MPDFKSRMNGSHVSKAGLDDRAERGSLDIGPAISSLRKTPVAGERAESHDSGAFFQGDVINSALGVVVPGSAMIAGPDSSHDSSFSEGALPLAAKARQGSLRLARTR